MSHPRRLFLKDFSGTISLEDIVPFPEDSKKHFLTVLRLKAGDKLTLVLPELQREFIARITDSEELFIEEEVLHQDTQHPVASLCIALCKGKKNELVIEKAVELGISSIYLLQAKHSVLDLRKESSRISRMKRYNKIAEQAAAQSYKSSLTSIAYCESCEEYLRTIDAISDSRSNRFLFQASEDSKELKSMGLITSPVHLLIGPEGDFAPREIESFLKHGFTSVSLGPWVLRSETAAITAIAQVLALSR